MRGDPDGYQNPERLDVLSPGFGDQMTFKGEGQYVTICLGCGRPLKKHERAFRVRDEGAIDYDERDPIDFLGHWCSDCKERMLKWLEQGIRGAVNREKDLQKALSLQDQQQAGGHVAAI
jgi:hypothetical protein